MKKFLMTLVAVALAAAPALAGDVTMSGKYTMYGYAWDIEGDTDAYYVNDFETLVTLKSGDVTAVIDLEVVDNNADEAYGQAPYRHNGGNDLVDNYYITAKLMDGLTLKTGEYGLDWGKKIAIYNQGGFNIGLIYTLNDKVTLSGTIAKVREGDYVTADWSDADTDLYHIAALMTNLGPLSKLNIHYASVMAEQENWNWGNPDYTDSLIGLEFAAGLGPVALSGEAGFFSGDNAEGNYFDFVFGLKELVGFDLAIELFQASDDMYTGFSENWSPLALFGNDWAEWFDGSWQNWTFIAGVVSYPVNDKLSIGGAVAMVTPTDGDGDGLEIDLSGTYKVADNFSLMAGYATASFSEELGDFTASLYTLKGAFTF